MSDELEEHFLDANARMGSALTEIGMALGLPTPRPGATWGASEILAEIVRLKRRPRVWFDDEDIPFSVYVLDESGGIHGPEEEDFPGEPRRMVGFGPLVEVRLPDYAAAVRAEREYRESQSGGVA